MWRFEMARIIDRRLDGKNKSAVNRRRLIRRMKNKIKQEVLTSANGRSITNMDAEHTITIPVRDLGEPVFGHASGKGRWEYVHIGNREYQKGDRVPRPQRKQTGERNDDSGKAGVSEDDFTFVLSREEFLDVLFEDMELPRLVRLQFLGITQVKPVHAGFVSVGPPSAVHVVRSLGRAIARRLTLSAPHKRRIEEILKELDDLRGQCLTENDLRIEELCAELESLQARLRTIPFLDTFDLRFRNQVLQAKPLSRAVMFCLMDVSGSMTCIHKDIAKRFFFLLYLFLKKNYEKIDVVFIRHHEEASEVDERTFFSDRETGGTIVSSALLLMRDIIRERYSSGWNVYGAQASDGDNIASDSPKCRDLLIEEIMPVVRYFAYVEIKPERQQSLWEAYASVGARCPNFASRQIRGYSDIYPVLRELFLRKSR